MWLVLVVLAACGDDVRSSEKALTTFRFTTAGNPSLGSEVLATINGNAVAATVPFGTDVTHLVATFVASADKVTVGGVVQHSGATANDFTGAVTYKVVAADGTSRDYTVKVTPAASPAKELTSFAFLAANNPGLGADVAATINGAAISATVPFGTDVTALVATYQSTGASVKVGATVQASGTTANSFASAVTYTVVAADGSTKDYTVTVIAAPNFAKEITAFSFLSVNNAGLHANVVATINGTSIAATVPFNTNATALVATFATTGASVTVLGTAQDSGTTANNFTAPVVYRVTAADGSTKDFTVTVTIAQNDAKDITAFKFESAKNSGLGADVIADINGTAIVATVPFGTDVKALVATFATSGDTVSVGGTAQDSGITENDFTLPVTYKVTAADGSTKDFIVTVNIAANTAKEITDFAFLSANNGTRLTADVIATVTGAVITATVPNGTDVNGLIADFGTTGASVSVGGTLQTSGATANDFRTPVTYTVTAADGSTKEFVVTVTIAPSSAKEITDFAFLSANNGTRLTADVIATVAGAVITATVPNGTDVNGLIADFATTGASVSVGGALQTSGATANDFRTPVTYTVTAADGSTKEFVVTVTIAPI